MTYKEAYKLLEVDETKMKLRSVSETKSYFIFDVVPINIKGPGSFAPSRAVDKKSGKIIAFNPMRVGADEMSTLKRIWPVVS